jgi:hypothetical protein
MFWAFYSNLVICNYEESGDVSDYTIFFMNMFQKDIDKYLSRFLGT